MEDIETKFPQNPQMKIHTLINAAQIYLRFFTIATTFAAALIIFTTKQTINVIGIVFKAQYDYSPAMKFLVSANIITCVFSASSLLALILIGRKGSTKKLNYFFLFIHDLLVMSLELAGCAAATAIGYVGRYGDVHSGWLAICDYVGKFCIKNTYSIALSYLAVAFLLVLTVMSAMKSREIHV